MLSGVRSTLGVHRLGKNSSFDLNADPFRAFLLLRSIACLVHKGVSYGSDSQVVLSLSLRKRKPIQTESTGFRKVGWFPFCFFREAEELERKPLKAFY